MSIERASQPAGGHRPPSNARSNGVDDRLPAEPDNGTAPADAPPRAREIGGPKGLEPTRYGDWEKAGRCIDF